MNFTLTDIKDVMSKYKDEWREIKHKLDEEVNMQREDQKDVIYNINTLNCPSIPKAITGDNVKELVKKEWNNEEALKILSCYSNTMTVIPPKSPLSKVLKIHKFIDHLRKIAEGANGMASLSKVRNYSPNNVSASDVFIVKSPLEDDEETNLDQLHEYFIGAYGTNRMRNVIPNFSYVFALFGCSAPILNDKEVVSYCQNTAFPVNYIVYEKVDGDTLSEFLSYASTNEILNVLTQILLAHSYAYEIMKFTHNDLHPRNVIVKEVTEEVSIKYQHKGEHIWLKTRYIPVFIDYGRAFIDLEGYEFGWNGLQIGASPVEPFALGDVHRILVQSIHKLKGVNMDAFEELKNILEIFTEEDIDDYLIESSKQSYIIPRKTYATMSTADFIEDYWFPTLEGTLDFLSDFPTVMEWRCKPCKSSSQIESEYFIDPTDTNDVYVFLENELSREEIVDELDTNYISYYDQILDEIERRSAEMDGGVHELESADKFMFEPNNLLDLADYVNSFTLLVYIRHAAKELVDIVYSNANAMKYGRDAEELYSRLKEYLDNTEVIIREEYDDLDTYLNRVKIRGAVKKVNKETRKILDSLKNQTLENLAVYLE